MKFDDLDTKMRCYEQSIDQHVLSDMYLVARLDGRSFSRLTKEICDFEAPFDERFRDMMVNTVKVLMDCGFRVVYGFTEKKQDITPSPSKRPKLSERRSPLIMSCLLVKSMRNTLYHF